jgi:thioredoxin reductase
VLLTIGRRGTPRRLDVPGEELPKVVYRLTDPEQYRGQRVLIVGGGDSALEAAIALSAQPGASVTLSYRGEAFSRVKERNRKLVGDAEGNGKVRILLQSTVRNIGTSTVTLTQNETPIELPNDAVIVCAGGVLPTPFLKEIGVMVETKYGKA